MFWCFCAYFQTTRNFFQKRYFWLSVVVKNVFWCTFAYFQTTRIMSLKQHTPRPPETFFQKRYFWKSGVVKNVFWCIFAYFQTTRNTRKLFFKKGIFYRLEWLKTCFDAFAHNSRPPETFFHKRYFWPSGVVKGVFWCICEYI